MKLKRTVLLAGITAGAFTSLLTPGIGHAALSGERFNISLGAQYFEWAEFDGSSQLLKETGPRYILSTGFDNYNRTSTGRLNGIEAAYYFGDVDYDGGTWGGEPVTSEVQYNGWAIDGMLGHRWANRFNRNSWDALIGVRYEDWDRDIQDSQLSDGTPVFGYEENWKVFYLKLGAGWNHRGRTTFHHLRGGINQPLWTEETIDFFGSKVELSPGKEVGWFIEYELDFLKKRNAKHGLKLVFEERNFSDSALAIAEIDGMQIPVYQPESRQRTITASYRYYF